MKIRFNRGPLRWWLIVIGLLLAKPALGAALAGTALVLLGSAVHLWSKGCLQQNRQLTVCGPYRWSRNPFYVGNFCIDLGLCLFINNTYFTIVFMIVWAVVYRWQILSEERTLDGIYGQVWLDYKRAVPAFLPYKRPYRAVPAEQGFSWSNPNLSTSREIPRLIRTASYPLLLLLAGGLWRHKMGFLTDPAYAPASLFYLGGFAGLQLLAVALKRQLHDRTPILPRVLGSPYLQIALVAAYLTALAVIDTGMLHAPRAVGAVGLALLAFGFYAVQRRQKQPCLRWDAFAWAGALSGAAVLAGMFWLGMLAVALAVAVCVDAHIAPVSSLTSWAIDGGVPDQPAVRPWDRWRLSSQYLLFTLLSLAIALSKASAAGPQHVS